MWAALAALPEVLPDTLILIGTPSPDRCVSPRPLYPISCRHLIVCRKSARFFPRMETCACIAVFSPTASSQCAEVALIRHAGYMQVLNLLVHGAGVRVARIEHPSMNNVSLTVKPIGSNV